MGKLLGYALAIFFGVQAWGTGTLVLAAPTDYPWLVGVTTNIACDASGVDRLASALVSVAPRDVMVNEIEGCHVFNGLVDFEVAAVRSGPFTDTDGDGFYAVELGKPAATRGWFAIAWPGFNAPKAPGRDA